MTTQHTVARLRSSHSSDRAVEFEGSQTPNRPSTEPGCESPPSPWPPLLPSLAAAVPAPASSLQELAELSSSELLAQLSTLVKQEQGLSVAVLLHLAEVERRELHLAKGYSSLFVYCVKRLGFSEDVAYKRVGAARYGRRFPMVLDQLGQGSLHLSALMLIGPHLTDANHREWLVAVAGRSKREVELFVATRCPKPDVPSSVRKLPKRQAPADAQAVAPRSQQAESCPSGSANAVGMTQPSRADATQTELESASRPALAGDTDASLCIVTQSAITGEVQPAIASEAQPRGRCATAAERPRVQPLSGTTFRVVFTASEALKQKLDRARELCSHSVAPADLPALLERAVDLLIEREEKRRFAVPSLKGGTTMRTSEIRAARPRLPRNHQEPDPVEPVEPTMRSPEPCDPVETTQRTLEPVEPIAPEKRPPEPATSAEPERRSPEPVASVDAKTVPPSCSRAEGPGIFEPFSLKEFSRHVPAAVRRAVWERDGGQCTFVDDEGHRCTERRFLEVDHVVAHARGGPTATGNRRLLCAAHNQHQAKLTFGSDFMDRARSRPRTR